MRVECDVEELVSHTLDFYTLLFSGLCSKNPVCSKYHVLSIKYRSECKYIVCGV